MFQQKWKAKQLVRGYHGDWIPEQKFKKGYLPNGLPPIVGNKSVGEAKVPLASMMFAEVEKRLDTVVFRCCFADSVYKARQMVIHGKVKLNGQKVSSPFCFFILDLTIHRLSRDQVTDANIKLQPGDMISVEPEAVSTLFRARAKKPATDSASSEPAASSETDSSVTPESPVPPPAPTPSTSSLSSPAEKPLRFRLPDFAAPFLFIPPYIEPSFSTCSAVYLRHPTASPGVSEVPSPYEADGEVMRLAWVSSPYPRFPTEHGT
jgi:ribosomal protein S4